MPLCLFIKKSLGSLMAAAHLQQISILLQALGGQHNQPYSFVARRQASDRHYSKTGKCLLFAANVCAAISIT